MDLVETRASVRDSRDDAPNQHAHVQRICWWTSAGMAAVAAIGWAAELGLGWRNNLAALGLLAAGYLILGGWRFATDKCLIRRRKPAAQPPAAHFPGEACRAPRRCHRRECYRRDFLWYETRRR